MIIPNNSTFAQVDAKLLSESCELNSFDLKQSRGRFIYFWRILLSVFKLIFGKNKLLFIWFADYHAAVAVMFAKLFKIPSIVFIGGYDAVCYPKLKMGVYCSKFRKSFASYALRNCQLIISNHEALLDSSNTFYNQEGHPEGVYRLVQELKTPAKVIYNALTVPAPHIDEISSERKDVFLAVGTTPRYQDIFNKGLDLVAQMALLHPEWKFEIVGIDPRWHKDFIRHLGGVLPVNLILLGYIDHPQVLSLMKDSRYFIQASISEGMPNALMEAMLMGCIPVGSKVSGIPTLISDYGVVFDRRDTESLEKALLSLRELELDPAKISEYMATSFSQEKRAKKLKEVVEYYKSKPKI